MGEASKRILLLEGNLAAIEQLRQTLADQPFELSWVLDLTACLRTLREDYFDLVLLSGTGLDATAVEMLHRLQQVDESIPVVVLAERDNPEESAQVLRLGAQDYLVTEGLTPEALGRALRHAIERHRRLLEMSTSALLDELTGLYNRRGLQSLAGPLWRSMARQHKGNTLLFLDVDNLKWINDQLGHELGDRALQETAEVLRETFRASDVLARVGGDEFAVLAVGTVPGSATVLVKRLEERVQAHNGRPDRAFTLSLSVGVAEEDPSHPSSLKQLLTLADARMYEQKQARHRARAGEQKEAKPAS